MPRTRTLITGASSGLGAEYARQLAAAGSHLILTARRADKLAEVVAEVTAAHDVQADVVVADLSTEAGIQSVAERIRATPDLDLLINNAGFGHLGTLAKSSLADELSMNSVHMTATLVLTKSALPQMIAAGGGEIINVSSIGAWMPMAGSVSYGATKSYINMLSIGLQMEVKDKGIRVQALCPGFTKTGFHRSDEFGDRDMSWVPPGAWMSAEQVVGESLDNLGKGVIYIPGEDNRKAVGQALDRRSFL